MARLIAFGCSFTYGHGLEDCFIENNRPGFEPSKFAWPSELAKLLELDYVNSSEPGCSNQEMLRRILSTSYQKDDIVVVLWTHYSRDVIYVKEGFPNSNTDRHKVSYLPIASWMVSDQSNPYYDEVRAIATNYYLAHSDIDQQFKKWLTIHHAETYLNFKGIKNFGFVVNSKEDLKGIPDFLEFKNLQDTYLYDIMFKNSPLAADMVHPGQIAHRQMAEEMYKIISS